MSARNALSVRLLLLDFEASTGLSELSEGERNVLAALILLGGSEGLVKPADLRHQPPAASLTHPTYHRMLRSLIERGIIEYKSDVADKRGYAIVLPSVALQKPEKSRIAV